MAQAHPGVGKQERKDVCRLLDSRKLSPEASLHAAQNQRLPVRAVIQVLFSEQAKLNWHIDWSGSFSGGRASPNLIGLEPRSQSKRAMAVEQMEIKRLKEDVLRLQGQCHSMQAQIERLLMLEKKKIGWFFRNWKKLGIIASLKPNTNTSTSTSTTTTICGHVGKKNNEEESDPEVQVGRQMDTERNNNNNNKLVRNKTSARWRRSSIS